MSVLGKGCGQDVFSSNVFIIHSILSLWEIFTYKITTVMLVWSEKRGLWELNFWFPIFWKCRMCRNCWFIFWWPLLWEFFNFDWNRQGYTGDLSFSYTLLQHSIQHASETLHHENVWRFLPINPPSNALAGDLKFCCILTWPIWRLYQIP